MQTAATEPEGKRILPESRATPFYPSLDGMRAIAIALVFAIHFLIGMVPFGWMGVQLFFVLSGFLITGILYDTRHTTHRFRNFYARRTLRIFPLYYGFLLFLACLVWIDHGHAPPYFWLWFVYLQNFWWLVTNGTAQDVFLSAHGHAFAAIGHLWSLAIEEQFYLLWPVLLFALKDRRRIMAGCVLLIVLRMGLAVYWQTHLSAPVLAIATLYRVLPTQWDAFLMGGLLALWLRGNPSVRVLRSAGRMAGVALAAFALLLAGLAYHPKLLAGRDVFDFSSPFEVLAGFPLTNLVSTLLILAAIQPGSWIGRFCSLRALRSLGKVSYGLYVYHLPVFVYFHPFVRRACDFLHVHDFSEWAAAIVATAITMAIAYPSYYWFEKPFLLLKNRFTATRAENASARVPVRPAV